MMDMDSIRPGLFLGSLDSIKDVSILADMGIQHVLSIMSEKPEMSQEIVVQKFVQVDDDPEANILQFLPECTEFLRHGLQKGGVLVHCYGGVSRSASVVIAYLMEKEGINVEEAEYEVKKSRSAVMPNDGFRTQLQLYHMMGNRIDQTDPRYKRFCLVQWANKVRFGIDDPPHALADDPQHSSTTQEVLFKCRKCRRVLLSSGNVIGHDQGTGQEAFRWHKRSSPAEVASNPKMQSKCTSLFIEPVSWMESAVVGTIQGKIACPKCSAKIGSFNWSGEQCSCGAWVTPSFQVHLNKLDKVIQHQMPQAQLLS